MRENVHIIMQKTFSIYGIHSNFLPYTPELNPIEIQWKGIKKGTANTLYGTEEEMQEPMRAMLGNGEVKVVKMVNYLT